MKIIGMIDSVLDRVEKFVCVGLLSLMCIVILVQIVLRLLNIPLSWTEELARYCFVWSIYVGASLAARYDKHLKVDIFQMFLKKRGQYVFNMIMNISALIFFIILAIIMNEVLKFFGVRTQTTAALKINMLYVYAAPFICSLLSIVRYAENIFRITFEYRQPEEIKEGV